MEMRLIVLSLCLTLICASSVRFDRPKAFAFLPSIRNLSFQSRLGESELERYPLGVEAVLSVALKLHQAFEDGATVPTNFLVSPLAVAGALGQLMLGARGEFRKQLGTLLTLQDAVRNRSSSTPDTDFSKIHNESRANLTIEKSARPIIGSRIRVKSIENHQGPKVPSLSAMRKDGLPGLELHRQLGGLIRALSSPLQKQGNETNVLAKSYLHASSVFFADKDLDVNEQFVRAVTDFYGSNLVPVNFREDPLGCQELINQWGSRETGGLISNFLEHPPPRDAAVMQLTAVHFRSAWETPFMPALTVPGLFKTSNATKVPVQFMQGTLEDVPYAESERLGIRIMAMPYSGSECSMYILLPKNTNELKYNIGKIIADITAEDITELLASTRPRNVNVKFPKLSLSDSLSLASALRKHARYMENHKHQRKMQSANNNLEKLPIPTTISKNNDNSSNYTVNSGGSLQHVSNARKMPSLFHKRLPISNEVQNTENTNQHKDILIFKSRMAEENPSFEKETRSGEPEIILSAASHNGQFRVSEMIQQIALEINEAGTEAAAIAGSTINYSGIVKNFKVDRPFGFFIQQEQTKAVLFWGTIVDPSS
ncbi:uncharacterized protein LOC107274947 [Cephus cinctus]|uniref:Uncharacterized protein LOC107274947 n=1 Tax=Cephus cinctus TaxID=211228 RepID=A0AAJ7CG42_CEPCN|nr:uncharacterized protein LOC107274947 [Cephus cinctus]